MLQFSEKLLNNLMQIGLTVSLARSCRSFCGG